MKTKITLKDNGTYALMVAIPPSSSTQIPSITMMMLHIVEFHVEYRCIMVVFTLSLGQSKFRQSL